MSNFVRLFKPQFARLVEQGKKRQTVRPIPVRLPKSGDQLSLREWTGKPYRSQQRILLATTCRLVHNITVDSTLLIVNGFELGSILHRNAFARADGFADWMELRDWFQSEHGLPFTGIVIYW